MIFNQIPSLSSFERAIATITALTASCFLGCRTSLGSFLNVTRCCLPRKSAWVRKRLAIVLVVLVFAGCTKSKSTDVLIGDLNSKEEIDRIKAVRLLPQRKGDSAKVVPALIESLKANEADVRWSAAIGLGYFGAEAKTALPALEEMQRDKDARVREGARVAISRIVGKQQHPDVLANGDHASAAAQHPKGVLQKR